jgi:hypothetical protein
MKFLKNKWTKLLLIIMLVIIFYIPFLLILGEWTSYPLYLIFPLLFESNATLMIHISNLLFTILLISISVFLYEKYIPESHFLAVTPMKVVRTVVLFVCLHIITFFMISNRAIAYLVSFIFNIYSLDMFLFVISYLIICVYDSKKKNLIKK